MGWRTQDAYDEARGAVLRALPLRERFNLRVLLRLALLVAFLGLVAWMAFANAAPIEAADISVIDGDTIRLHHQKPDVRLVGFNAPETRRASCEAERQLGAHATQRVRELVRSAK